MKNKILKILEKNDGLCMDVPAERKRLANALVRGLGNGKVNVVLELYAGVPDVTVYEDPKEAEKHVRGFFDSQNIEDNEREIVENGTTEEFLEFLSDWLGETHREDEIHWFETSIKPKKEVL